MEVESIAAQSKLSDWGFPWGADEPDPLLQVAAAVFSKSSAVAKALVDDELLEKVWRQSAATTALQRTKLVERHLSSESVKAKDDECRTCAKAKQRGDRSRDRDRNRDRSRDRERDRGYDRGMDGRMSGRMGPPMGGPPMDGRYGGPPMGMGGPPMGGPPMGGRMGPPMDGRMGPPMDGRYGPPMGGPPMDGRYGPPMGGPPMGGRMGPPMDGRMDPRMMGGMDSRMGGRMGDRYDGGFDGRMDDRAMGRMDGRMDRRTEGRMEPRSTGRMDDDRLDGRIDRIMSRIEESAPREARQHSPRPRRHNTLKIRQRALQVPDTEDKDLELSLPEFTCPYRSCRHVASSQHFAVVSWSTTDRKRGSCSSLKLGSACATSGAELMCVHDGCVRTFRDAQQWRHHVMEKHHGLLGTKADFSTEMTL